MPTPIKNRLRRYYIDSTLLVAYLNAQKHWPAIFGRGIITDIPDDAQVVSVYYSADRRCLVAHVYHESFAEVPAGAEVPEGMGGYVEITNAWFARGQDGAYQPFDDLQDAASWRSKPPML